MVRALFAPSNLESAESGGWVSIADMMTGLMVVFMFIAIIYIDNIQEQNAQIREIAVAFEEAEADIYDALVDEFETDLPVWNAIIDRESLAIRFQAPEVLFLPGSSALRPEFKDIIDDFFPRYIRVLDAHADSIEEVRIEGHTSSDWAGEPSEMQAYFNNMGLSQARTRSVLSYSLDREGLDAHYPWARRALTANGLSSSRPIKTDGAEDRKASRRVEFKVRTDAKTQMVRVLQSVDAR